MDQLDAIAHFARRAQLETLTPARRQRLKTHVLDTIGCLIGALDAGPTRAIRALVDSLGGTPQCTLVAGGATAIDRAALYHGALVRYLDFMDAFIAPGAECHPSDNFAALLAGAELADASGAELMTALAVAYQVECRICESLTLVTHGLDHTTALSFSIAAGLSRLLGLGHEETVNALAIAGADSLGLMATRREPLSQWKGLASAGAAMRSTVAVLMAAAGVTGPRAIFSGAHSLESIVGKRLLVDWEAEPLDIIDRVLIKRYDAEARAQSAIDVAIELHHRVGDDAIAHVEVTTFASAFDAIGGGRFGDKSVVATREQADHNLAYLVAVALLDGAVGPAQFDEARLHDADVQSLLQRVEVTSSLLYSMVAPWLQPARVTVHTADGRTLRGMRLDYEGFITRPMTWEAAVDKLTRLARPFASQATREQIIATVASLEMQPVTELTRALGELSLMRYEPALTPLPL